ncbi:hypothetical protein ACIXN9_11910 [Bacteroides fragilis]
MKKENKKITDLVKTFDDARRLTGRPDVPDFSNLPTDMRKHFEAQYKMIVIVEALNEGWIPDWDNNEYKYYPWFEMSPSSFAFDDSSCADADAIAGSGSRLCLKNKELSEYCGKQFIDLWKQFII